MTQRPVFWISIMSALALAMAAVFAFPLLASAVERFFESSRSEAAHPVAVPGATLGGTTPGSLVSAMTMPGFLRQLDELHHGYADKLRAARVVYRSTSGDGQPTLVSGSVFVPAGDPPDGGWPVVSFGHGTTGIDEPCAPSLSDSLLGMTEVVTALVGRGYAVALADYEGLGMPGVHPYTDSHAAGLNMIDAVRALRATFTGVSTRWGAYGASQGGGAAWAADEQASSYAPELEFVGAVAISPVADVTGMVTKAQEGTLTSDQEPGVPTIVESLARLYPDISRDDYRRGAGARYWNALVACSGPDVKERSEALMAVTPRDFAPSTPQAAERLRQHLAQWALPQQRLSAPLYVWYGGADTIIDAPWIAGAVQRACALGGTVVVNFATDKGHGAADYFEQLRWLTDRFLGKPVTNDCA